MERCPVCNRELHGAVCPECGFDRSRNYKTNSTRCRISNDVCDGAERRKMPANVFACPECGKNLFHFYPEAGALRCVSCRHLHQIELKKQEKQVTAPQAAPVQTDEDRPVFGNTIAAGGLFTLVLQNDGTVAVIGSGIENQYEVDSWSEIISVSARSSYAVGLRRDGTVVAAGENSWGRCNIDSWTDIVAIAAGGLHTVGLRRDGTVVAVGQNYWGVCDTDSWSDIVAIAAGPNNTVGLRHDGTVVAVGYNSLGHVYCDRFNPNSWRDIIAIAVDKGRTVGLRRDRTVVVDDSSDRYLCHTWRGIAAIATREKYTIAVKNDGTVESVGIVGPVLLKMDSWTNIISTAIGSAHTVGLHRDGTLVATGWNICGQCKVSDFRAAIPGTPIPW